MSHKIVFLDIDGTILKPDHTIAPSTKEAVSRLKEKGIQVVIATGRPLCETLHIANDLNITSYITFNGAHATIDGKELFQKTMNQKTIEFLISNSQLFQHDLMLYTKDKNFFSNPDSPRLRLFLEGVPMNSSFGNFQNSTDKVLGGTLITEEDNEIDLYHSSSDIQFSRGNVDRVSAFDILTNSVNKGTAIRDYLLQIGIEPSSAVAFGDGMNDKEMLSFVGTGIAMGNAQKSLLPYADLSTTSVNEDGIWNGLKKIGLIE